MLLPTVLVRDYCVHNTPHKRIRCFPHTDLARGSVVRLYMNTPEITMNGGKNCVNGRLPPEQKVLMY